MRIIWWSPAFPYLPTAYARCSFYLPRELERLGHEVHIFSCGGHGGGRLNIDGLRLYPNPVPNTLGLDFVKRLSSQLKADLVIWEGDFWPWPDSFEEASLRLPLIFHGPVDHYPFTLYEQRATAHCKALAVYSRWGREQVLAAGLKAFYAPLGCNLEIYKPGDRGEARRALGWPSDCFIYIFVAANKQDRKYHYGLLRAYKMLLERRPELRARTRIAFHTYPYRDEKNDSGYDLWNLSASLEVQTQIIWSDSLAILEGVSEQQLALMYQASNVHVLPSKCEGFGLPLIEAGACGIPSIGTNHSSVPEILEDRGWLIEVADWEVQQLLGYAWQAVPSTAHLSQLLERVFDHPEEVAAKGEAMRRHVVENYSWERAGDYWPALLESIESRQIPTTVPYCL